MEFETLTSFEIDKCTEMMGKRGGEILSILGRLYPTFISHLDTMVGKEILMADVNLMGELLEKIYNEDATPEEKAEFRVLKKRVSLIIGKLDSYIKNTNNLRKVINVVI